MPENTRKDLEKEALDLGISEDEIKLCRTKSDVQILVDEYNNKTDDSNEVEKVVEEKVVEEKVVEEKEDENIYKDGDLLKVTVASNLKKDGIFYTKGDKAKFRYNAELGSLIADGILAIN